MSAKTASLLALSIFCTWGCSDEDTPDDGAAGSSAPQAGTGQIMAGASPVTGSGTTPPAGEPTPMMTPPPAAGEGVLPIVFVHGFAGSAQQLISQAMRFESNGWPAGHIRAFEHHGGMSGEDFVAGLSAFVDAVLAELKVPQVYLIGHSRGTSVSSMYLGDPARAAKIAKYIALDGSPCTAAMTAGVPCVAPNQAALPGQAHVEVATSLESFLMQYEFLTGRAPQVTAIVKQDGPVVISGRAVNFPENTGRAGTTMQIWEIDSQTGQRSGAAELASFEITENGNWGPVTVDPDKHYEMVLLAAEGKQHHFYFQRFLRSTPFVRLLSGPPDTPARQNTNSSDDHSTLIVSRMREWKTSDVLEISTKTSDGDQPAVNAIAMGVGKDTGFASIGIHIHDDVATPKESSLGLLPWFSTQPFQTGVDVYMPAADPPAGTITVTSMPRGDTSRPQVLAVPNWRSSGHAISLGFSDYAQD